MMTQAQALQVLARHRGTRVVIASMGSAAVWPGLSDTPLDFVHIPSSMGQAPALGLGLALAHPARGCIVLSGDGSLLMNLGCLVTIAAHPTDLYLVVLDNGLYEITGGQPTAGSGCIDFAALARAAGISRAYAFAELASWEAGAAAALSGPGPTLSWVRIEGRRGQGVPTPPRPMREQIRRLQQALGVEALFPEDKGE